MFLAVKLSLAAPLVRVTAARFESANAPEQVQNFVKLDDLVPKSTKESCKSMEQEHHGFLEVLSGCLQLIQSHSRVLNFPYFFKAI